MRRGRKRKSGARKPCGRLRTAPADDRGTVQLQARRRALVGIDGDPARAASPIGIMHARRLIDDDQERAAAWYGRAYVHRHGQPHPQGALSDPHGPAAHDKPWLDTAYWAMTERLDPAQRHALTEAIVMERLPRWLRAQIAGAPVTAADHDNRLRFLDALDTVTQVYRRRRRGVGVRDALYGPATL